jgi:hypothetical protein
VRGTTGYSLVMSDHESTAQREGIVDQQDAAIEAMEQGVPEAGTGAGESTAEREGIVDQQDAAIEAMEEGGPAQG